MFTWAGERIDTILNTYVAGTLAQVFNWAAVVAAGALTLYVLLYAIAIVRGEVSEPVSEFLWKSVKLGLILALATTASGYREYVQEIAEALTTSMAAAFRPAVDDAPAPVNMWEVSTLR